jgi:hypothetical protein
MDCLSDQVRLRPLDQFARPCVQPPGRADIEFWYFDRGFYHVQTLVLKALRRLAKLPGIILPAITAFATSSMPEEDVFLRLPANFAFGKHCAGYQIARV